MQAKKRLSKKISQKNPKKLIFNLRHQVLHRKIVW